MHLIFDLDGVLVEFRHIHKRAFIEAWNATHPEHKITELFHDAHLEARSTRQKTAICSDYFGLPEADAAVFEAKQTLTERYLADAPVYAKTKEALAWALINGHTISCCSNSIRSTVHASLYKLVPSLDSFSVILSNEDVVHPKPHPEIYKLAVERLGADPAGILVYEDSIVGRDAAKAAGLRVIPVYDSLDITPRFLEYTVAHGKRPVPPTLNVVIPMAGLGSRFQKCGYSTPKPFLPIFGTPMFKWVIQNIVPPSLRDRAIVHIIIREEHKDRFMEEKNDERILIHTVPELTEGAACTVLTVKDYINTDAPLVVANSDQYLEWDAESFYTCLFHPDYDGVISTFEQPDTSDLRWSYANLDAEGCVTRVAEKEWIGPLATTGVYGWARGSDYVAQAERMIRDNVRVNNEFYVCPVYNVGIVNGQHVRTHNCKKMWGLGVPADYEHFLSHFAAEK